MQKIFQHILSINAHYRYVFTLLCVIVSAGCSNTGYLQPEEKLYTGAELVIRDEGEISDVGDLEEQLEKIISPQPNGTIFGLFKMKLWLYNVGIFSESLGEPPVLMTNVDADRVALRMQTFLENKGYLHAEVHYSVHKEEKTEALQYLVDLRLPYRVSSFTVKGDDSPLLTSIRNTMKESLINVGELYDLDKLKQERIRIDAMLKDSGYFYFAPDLLQFQADSSSGGNLIALTLTVKGKVPADAARIYTIGNIYVYSGYALNRDSISVGADDTLFVNGIEYIDIDRKFDPDVIIRSIFIAKGSLYSGKDHDMTLNRLMNLGVFKFVNIRFVKSFTAGTPRLDVHIYLTPLVSKTIRFELQGVSKSNNVAGPVFNSSFRNRNMFGGVELFTFNLEAGFETSFRESRGSSYEIGTRGSLELPKFVVPFTRTDVLGRFVPKTRIALGFRLLHRLQYYQMFSTDASFGYNWKESESIEHSFNPFSITFAQLTETSALFDALLSSNPFLRKSFEEQFIIGENYSFIYNNQMEKEMNDHWYFKGSLDFSGNILQLIQSLSKTEKASYEHPYKIFGAPYAEYSKGEIDVRHYFNFNSQTSALAVRMIAGVGFAYGNSLTLPYVKQFSSGGSNSVRAFDARALGPGSYNTRDSVTANSFTDQAGDIKLEANIEYRFPIVSIVRGALFVDAGNIWLRKEDPNRLGGTFAANSFVNEIAVGTGFGIRLDLSFLILRFDLAFPLRVPNLPENERWVLKAIDVGSADWRKQNLVLNIAIGYPF